CNGGSRQLTGAFLHPLASASAFLEQRFPDRCVDHGPCSAPLELTCPVSLQPVRASCLHLFGRLCHACAASARGWVTVRGCGSDGARPHTRQACSCTNFRWSLSRRRIVLPKAWITPLRDCLRATIEAFWLASASGRPTGGTRPSGVATGVVPPGACPSPTV